MVKKMEKEKEKIREKWREDDLKLYDEAVEQKAKIIQKKGIKVTGDYTFLGYNAPYQFWSRKNEVVIPIEWKE